MIWPAVRLGAAFLAASLALVSPRGEGVQIVSVGHQDRPHRKPTVSGPISLGTTPNNTWAGSALLTPRHTLTSVSVTFKAPDYLPGPTGQTIALWVGLGGLESIDATLAQAGIAATRLPNGTIQSSLIAQDWPRPWKARVGVSSGDTITVYCGRRGKAWLATVTDETTGQTLTVPVKVPRAGGWASVEGIAEIPAKPGTTVLIPSQTFEWRDFLVNGSPVGPFADHPTMGVGYYMLQVGGQSGDPVNVAVGTPFVGSGAGIRWLSKTG